jgi:Zn-dependent protease
MELTIVQKIAIWSLPLIFAITLHEVAHGFVANLFGDKTARFAGRLTLNPIKHIDPIGTILVPILFLTFSGFVFGWAKPVPVDPRNLHHPRRDMALVALAGPVSNLLMAFFWGLIMKLSMLSEHTFLSFFSTPFIYYMGQAGVFINVILAVLNIIPIPPLDGSKVLSSVLPRAAAYHFTRIEPFGFMILILLMFTGILSNIMNPFIGLLVNFITNIYGLV